MRSGRRRREANRRSIIDNLETTPATVAERPAPLIAEDEIGDIDFDWRPRPLERVVQGTRSFRWPIIGAALVLAALAILMVQGLGTFSEEQADERLAAYRAEVTEFEAALDELEASLPNVGVEQALAFTVATDSLREVAAEELPGLPPFVPRGALAEVSRTQDHLLAMTDVATSVSSDIDVAAAFAAASETLLAVPALPSSVPEELIAPAGEAITDMQSETEATLALLEPNDTFATYLQQVQDALDTLPDWTDRYLLALRRGDVETAEILVAELIARHDQLMDELAIGLTTISKGVEERIAELRAAITQADVMTAT